MCRTSSRNREGVLSMCRVLFWNQVGVLHISRVLFRIQVRVVRRCRSPGWEHRKALKQSLPSSVFFLSYIIFIIKNNLRATCLRTCAYTCLRTCARRSRPSLAPIPAPEVNKRFFGEPFKPFWGFIIKISKSEDYEEDPYCNICIGADELHRYLCTAAICAAEDVGR